MNMTKKLSEKECLPCMGGVEPLKGLALLDLLSELGNEWKIVNEHHIEKKFEFTNFRKALDFVNAVGEIAEEQRHHPDIHFGYGYARILIWTHKIDGLTESDFVLAAKIEEVR